MLRTLGSHTIGLGRPAAVDRLEEMPPIEQIQDRVKAAVAGLGFAHESVDLLECRLRTNVRRGPQGVRAPRDVQALGIRRRRAPIELVGGCGCLADPADSEQRLGGIDVELELTSRACDLMRRRRPIST